MSSNLSSSQSLHESFAKLSPTTQKLSKKDISLIQSPRSPIDEEHETTFFETPYKITEKMDLAELDNSPVPQIQFVPNNPPPETPIQESDDENLQFYTAPMTFAKTNTKTTTTTTTTQTFRSKLFARNFTPYRSSPLRTVYIPSPESDSNSRNTSMNSSVTYSPTQNIMEASQALQPLVMSPTKTSSSPKTTSSPRTSSSPKVSSPLASSSPFTISSRSNSSTSPTSNRPLLDSSHLSPHNPVSTLTYSSPKTSPKTVERNLGSSVPIFNNEQDSPLSIRDLEKQTPRSQVKVNLN